MIPIHEHIANPKSKEVFQSIRRHGTVSKQTLLEESGLTVSTLTRILDDLRAQGLILEVGFGESTGGRRPILYETNPSYSYLFGLEISRIHSKLVLFDFHLKPLEESAWSMDAGMTPDRLIGMVAEHIPRMLQQRFIPLGQVLGLGIGAVGPLDRKQGIILSPLHFAAEGWKDVSIAQSLESRLSIPVFLDNGANTALLGEYWTSDYRHHHHLLYLHAGIGLRSAMMNEGRILYGVVDTEGSVGQMIIESAGIPPRTPGGNYGAWESYVSIRTLEMLAAERWKQGRRTSLEALVASPDRVKYHHLTIALASGDPMVTELFLQAAAYFGIGLANLMNVIHPEEVILGGPLILSHDLFFQEATRIAQEKTYSLQNYEVRFMKGRLGEDAVSTGAAALVLGKLTEKSI